MVDVRKAELIGSEQLCLDQHGATLILLGRPAPHTSPNRRGIAGLDVGFQLWQNPSGDSAAAATPQTKLASLLATSVPNTLALGSVISLCWVLEVLVCSVLILILILFDVV